MKAVLLRDRYLKSDSTGLLKRQLENLEPNREHNFRFMDALFYDVFYSFERRLKALFSTRYLIPMKARGDMLPDNRDALEAENEDLRNEIGYSGELIDPYIISSGVKITTDSNNSTANDDVITMMFSAPLLCNPDTFGAFTSLVFNRCDKFIDYLVLILSSIPVVYVYTSEHMEYQWTVFPASMLLYAHFVGGGQYGLRVTWNFEWNHLTLNSGADYRENNGPFTKPNVINSIARIIKLNWEIIMTKAITVKCMRDWDKDLTCGYFVICDPSPDNHRTIDWIDDFRGYNNPNIPGDIHNKFSRTVVFHLIEKFGFNNGHFGMEEGENPLNVNLLNNNVNFISCGYNLEHGITLLRDVANPFACFGSLNEEDFSAFCLLMFSSIPSYLSMGVAQNELRQERAYQNLRDLANADPLAVDITLLGSITNLVYGGTLNVNIQSLYFNKVRLLLNECLNRKIFKINRITQTCFIKSTPDYTFLYVIPMEKANFNIKYYLKRNFFNFFKFFDNVYYKPKYLRYLTDEGLRVLKHLSKFDSNYIDSLGARMYLSTKLSNIP